MGAADAVARRPLGVFDALRHGGYEYVTMKMKTSMIAAAARQRPAKRSSRAVKSRSAIASPQFREDNYTPSGRVKNHTVQGICAASPEIPARRGRKLDISGAGVDGRSSPLGRPN
jgi:hypothetical protein